MGDEEQELLDQLTSTHGSSLWLGLYSSDAVMRALRRHGIVKALHARGLRDLRLQIETLDVTTHALSVHDGEPEPDNLVIELRLRTAPLKEPPHPRLLHIEWQLLQDPRASFDPRRPALPGQQRPGFGQARTILNLLVEAARRLHLEGLSAVPERHYPALIYRDRFRFHDPAAEGLIQALCRDLPVSLAEQAWALELNCVRDCASGAPFRWEPATQVLPLSDRLVRYFASPEYSAGVDSARESLRFELDRACFEERYRQVAGRAGGTMAAVESTMQEQFPSIARLLRQVAEVDPRKVVYRYKQGAIWHDVSWQEHVHTVQAIARGLMALDVVRGERVAVLSQTRLEWVQSDFGIGAAGGVTVGIYPSNLPPECRYILDHSDSVVLFAENEEQLQKIREVRSTLPQLRQVVLYEGEAEDAMSWGDFLEQGSSVTDEQLEARIAEIQPDDLCSLVYTSGTTGVPKGAMISHGNLLFASWSASEVLYTEPHFITLLFLPLAHVFARLIVYTALHTGNAIAFAESVATVADNLKEIRPHYIASAPRIYEKVYDKITSGVAEAGGIKQKLFDWALGVGTQVSRLQRDRQPIPGGLALKHKIANKLVFHKIQAALGGRLVYAVSGAAPLNPDIAEFFHACGVLILEGLGMTENTSFSNINHLENFKFGTVGLLGPGIEIKLEEDGEILFRGPNVMPGYFKNPTATAETIDGDGWLHSGDIGEIDDDGFLRITDRKKDLIITAGGKNVAPQRVEKLLRASHYISQVVAVGDRRKFISALISLEPEAIAAWAGAQGIAYTSMEQLAEHPQVQALIEGEVAARCRQLASFESVKKFRILPEDLTVESGDMTPTFKIRRKHVLGKHSDLVEEMYQD